MGPVAVGWALIGIGVCFLLLGLVGAVLQLLPGPKSRTGATGFVKAVTELIRVLSKAPMWLSLTTVGVILVVIGSRYAFP